MKKYTKVLSATLLFFVALGLASCKNYSSELDEITSKNEELTQKLEKLEADLKKAEEEQSKTQEELDVRNFKARKEAYAKFLSENSTVKLDKLYSYTGQYGTEELKIESSGKISYYSAGIPMIDGDLLGAEIPAGYDGFILYVKNESHTNYGKYCYPDYDEDTWPGTISGSYFGYDYYVHLGCYSAFYIIANDTTGNTCKMASAVWSVPNHTITACAKTLSDARKLFSVYGYDSTCNNSFTSFSIVE